MIGFYESEVHKEVFEHTLCLILNKCYLSKEYTLVLLPEMDLLERINIKLWTFMQKSFVPHGGPLDPNPTLQPIYLTTTLEENISQAKILVLVNRFDDTTINFSRKMFIFEGQHKDAAIETYKRYPQASYYKQQGVTNWQQINVV